MNFIGKTSKTEMHNSGFVCAYIKLSIFIAVCCIIHYKKMSSVMLPIIIITTVLLFIMESFCKNCREI